MPRILINEKDKTSPGTPDSYANYSVLITGFSSKTADELETGTIKPDPNGVFEFSSAQDFKDTIGLVPPEHTWTVETGDGSKEHHVCHYGNQMAYELLNMGYSIVYKPLGLTKVVDKNTQEVREATALEAVQKMDDAKFWEIFKDKASYDFRFITHGLLNSADFSTDANYSILNERLNEVVKAIEKLVEIDITAKNMAKETEQEKAEGEEAPETEESLEELEIKFKDYLYNLNKTSFDGFENQTTNTLYDDYATAYAGTQSEQQSLEEALAVYNETGLVENAINNINKHIADLAMYVANDGTNTVIPGRGDCVALIELDEAQYNDSTSIEKPEVLIVNAINKMSGINADNGKYCAMTVPSVQYKMSDNSDFANNKKFPGAFHYLACFMNSLKSGFAEWYAAAGYTRGVSSYMIDYTTVKLGEIAINALEPRNIVDQDDNPKFACNVIANFRGSYYLWGNRTAHPLTTKAGGGDLVASHFLNIRQLCTTIKKQLYIACRRFTFDPNSDTLWFNFVNAIRPTLEAMKADQGIRDYKIIKVFTDKKATLKAKIRVIPIEAVEDFDLEVSLEDSFGETTAVVLE